MKIEVQQDPEVTAGALITDSLKKQTGNPVLLILSGGSALSVLEHIDSDALSDNLTIALADERYTYDTPERNFEKLAHTNFFSSAQNRGVQFIDYTQNTSKSLTQYVHRINASFDALQIAHPTLYTIALLGIGEDGHTASIFPSSQQDFESVYLSKQTTFIPVEIPGDTHPQRISITPSFIENSIDEIFLYAKGKNKCFTILMDMFSNHHDINQIPALIPARHHNSTLCTDCNILPL